MSLSHPNILPVIGFEVHEKKPILVMEHVPSSSLRERHLRGVPVPLPTIVSYVKNIAGALQHAHDRGIIHRNINPEHVFVGTDNRILLAGFGIPTTQADGGSSSQLSIKEQFYKAPEQFAGTHHPASDQYALAVMVYEWLSGERPFYGSVADLARKHREVPPPPLHEKVPALSSNVEQVVMKALAKKPEQRYDSVLEFATALESAST